MDMIFGLLGFLAMIVGFILLVVTAIRKKPLKKSGIIIGTGFLFLVIGLALPGAPTEEVDGASDTQSAETATESAEKVEEDADKEVTEEKTEEDPEAAEKAEAEARKKEEAAEKEEAAKKAEAAEKAAKEQEAAAKEVAEEPADLESQVRSIVHEEIGEKTNMDKERIVELNVVELPNGSNVVLDLNASENLTTNMTRTGILMNSMDILEPLSKLESIANIKIVWLFPLVDQYGNEEDGRVLSFVIDKETRDKINWENFDQENLATVTADYFEHPAFKE